MGEDADSADFGFTDMMTMALWMYGLEPDSGKNRARMVNKRGYARYALIVSSVGYRLLCVPRLNT